jgi:hypothetical protein
MDIHGKVSFIILAKEGTYLSDARFIKPRIDLFISSVNRLIIQAESFFLFDLPFRLAAAKKEQR